MMSGSRPPIMPGGNRDNVLPMPSRSTSPPAQQIARGDVSAYNDNNNIIRNTNLEVNLMPDNEKYYEWMKEDRRENEERMRAMMADMKQHSRDIEERMKQDAADTRAYSREIEARMEKRHDENISEMRELRREIKEDFKDVKKDSTEAKRWIIGLCFATILGIAAMVIAIWIQ